MANQEVLIPKLVLDSRSFQGRKGRRNGWETQTAVASLLGLQGLWGNGCLSLFASLGPPGCPGDS